MKTRPTTEAADELLGLYFPVLDHGFVSLVDYMGGDADIERAARVSFGDVTEPRNLDKTRTLLRYLRRHKHTTPSEMVELKFHCCMPIFVARQWIRHRTANVNEASGRYSMLPMLFYTPEKEQFRAQSKTNKQGRSNEELDIVRYQSAVTAWKEGRQEQASRYEMMVEWDVARELARIDLPLSTYTQWYWKIDLHNLLHFLTLRVDSHAQWEIRQFARVMAGIVKRVAPLSYEAWIDYDVCGVRFSRAEMEIIRMYVTSGQNSGWLPGPSGYGKESGLLSGREVDEFAAKLDEIERPDFELDLGTAKPGEFFFEKMKQATPSGERA
jgi:thymidylate synthase (FAD)